MRRRRSAANYGIKHQPPISLPVAPTVLPPNDLFHLMIEPSLTTPPSLSQPFSSSQAEFLCNQGTMNPIISRIDEPVPCTYIISLLWNGACDSDAQVAASLNAEAALAVAAHAAASQDVSTPKAGDAVAASADASEMAPAAQVASSIWPHSTAAAASADAPQPQAPAADADDDAAAASAQEGAGPGGK